MKTLKELQAQIEDLQREKETLTTLCEFIPEKLAVFFKPTYLNSGYSIKLLSERINARNNEGVKLENEKKALLLACINYKESKIKELIY